MAGSRTTPMGFALAALFSVGAAVAGDADVVVRVGDKTATIADVTRRLREMPDFQRAALGGTDTEIKRKVLEEGIVRELLYSAEAERQKLNQRPSVQDRLREALRQAMERELQKQTLEKKPVTFEEIKGYFEKNREKFEVPRRLRLWRVLVKDEAAAKKLIADAAGAGGPQRWSKFAREHSLDKATHQRDGDLGFVRADGSTDTPQLRVDPALFAAADKVENGAIIPEPVREGSKFAVVWRRGSMPAVKRKVEEEQLSIRQVLERERIDQARSALLTELRKKSQKLNVELVDKVPGTAFGDFEERRQHSFPGARRSVAAGTPPKKDGEGALR